MLFADAGEWKIQGKGGSRPIKRDSGDKMMSGDTAESAGGSPAAASAKPAWLNNVSPKGSPVKAQAAIKKEIDALARADVYNPLKKAGKVNMSAKATAVGPIKKARQTSNKGSSVLANIPVRQFTLTW